jgi:hypothetical protein
LELARESPGRIDNVQDLSEEKNAFRAWTVPFVHHRIVIVLPCVVFHLTVQEGRRHDRGRTTRNGFRKVRARTVGPRGWHWAQVDGLLGPLVEHGDGLGRLLPLHL